MLKSNIKIYLNNNPKCETILESTVKNEVWQMKNTPYVMVIGENIKDGINKNIKVIIDDKKFYEGTINVNNSYFSLKVELDEPINNPNEVEVLIEDKKYVIPIELKRIYGTVKYYDGKPVSKPIIDITGKDIVAIGNENGSFEIYICGKEQQIGVFEKDYSKNTLESWLYNIDLKEDTLLDIRIDKMEVYRINMWEGERSDYIHFVPMSLSRVKEAMNKGFKNEMNLLEHKNIWPKLRQEDIRIYANNEEVKILTFQEVEDYLAEYKGRVYIRPSYLVSIPKGYKNKIIKIEVKSKFIINDKEVTERGEGYYFW